MTAALTEVLATPGIWLVVLGAFVGSVIRGFTGFGTALIYVPLAMQVLPPAAAIAVLAIFDIFGPLPLVRSALRNSALGDLGRLVLGMGAMVPVGLAALLILPAAPVRWAVSLIVLVLLAVLVSGWRYRGRISAAFMTVTGVMGGLLGGTVGLPGPPVILLYMSTSDDVTRTRATILLYLFAFDIIFLGAAGLSGGVELGHVLLGLVLAPAAILGAMIGARMFDPSRARLYRIVAYAVIAAAALSSLPIAG